MADETAQETTITAPEEPKPETQQAQKGKVFSQEEVNAIVAREKAAWKKSADRDKEALSAVETNLRGDLTFYEEKMQSFIKTQISDFDPITLDLFQALPIREQLEKLSDETFLGKVRRKNVIPETPKSEGSGGRLPFTRKQSV